MVKTWLGAGVAALLFLAGECAQANPVTYALYISEQSGASTYDYVVWVVVPFNLGTPGDTLLLQYNQQTGDLTLCLPAVDAGSPWTCSSPGTQWMGSLPLLGNDPPLSFWLDLGIDPSAYGSEAFIWGGDPPAGPINPTGEPGPSGTDPEGTPEPSYACFLAIGVVTLAIARKKGIARRRAAVSQVCQR